MAFRLHADRHGNGTSTVLEPKFLRDRRGATTQQPSGAAATPPLSQSLRFIFLRYLSSSPGRRPRPARNKPGSAQTSPLFCRTGLMQHFLLAGTNTRKRNVEITASLSFSFINSRLRRATDMPGTSVLRGRGTVVTDLEQTGRGRVNALAVDLITLSLPLSSAIMSSSRPSTCIKRTEAAPHLRHQDESPSRA